MKILVIIWASLSFLLLAAGVLLVVFSIMWRDAGDAVLQFLLPFLSLDLTISLGISYLAAVAIALPAFFMPPTRLLPLKVLAGYSMLIAVFTLASASVVWIFSLRERDNCSDLWALAGPDIQRELQDRFSCCGYWNATLTGQFSVPQGFCADLAFAAFEPGCMAKVTDEADHHLSFAFTSIYACEAIIIALALATGCLIKERRITARFKLIDEKRGGGGFV